MFPLSLYLHHFVSFVRLDWSFSLVLVHFSVFGAINLQRKGERKREEEGEDRENNKVIF